MSASTQWCGMVGHFREFTLSLGGVRVGALKCSDLRCFLHHITSRSRESKNEMPTLLTWMFDCWFFNPSKPVWAFISRCPRQKTPAFFSLTNNSKSEQRMYTTTRAKLTMEFWRDECEHSMMREGRAFQGVHFVTWGSQGGSFEVFGPPLFFTSYHE